MKKYIVSLSGQGDTYLFCVDKDVLDWIRMEADCPERFCKSEKLAEEYDNFNPTEGSSPDNDRALMYMGFIEEEDDDEEVFWSIGSLLKHIRENKLDVCEDESYDGYIY